MNLSIRKLLMASGAVATSAWFVVSFNYAVAQSAKPHASVKSIPDRVKDLEEAMNYARPPGTVVAYAVKDCITMKAPVGWTYCDGRSVRKDDPDYKKLFEVIGTNHGSESAETFNLPDYRGLFLRGFTYETGGTTTDPDRTSRTAMKPGGLPGAVIGSVQADAFQGHYHEVRTDDESYVFNQKLKGGAGASITFM
ncbi:MAG: tail fiber protein, partial [Chitinophagaceae bacterium]